MVAVRPFVRVARSELDELVHKARAVANEVATVAAQLLAGGHDADRVHRQYVVPVVELWHELEVRAVLASAGDDEGLRSVRRLAEELRRLRDDAGAELADDR